MGRLVAVAALLILTIVGALAQTQPTQPMLPRTSTPRVQPRNPISPCYQSEIGPCSSEHQPSGISVPTAPYTQAPTGFTVDQAKAQIQAGGYTNVTGLQQDGRGNWNGKAVKDGETVEISVDLNGNVKSTGGPNGSSQLGAALGHAFTVDQAKSQIEAGGYSAVTQLKKDSRGNWHGRAIKDGGIVDVTLNFNGSIETKK